MLETRELTLVDSFYDPSTGQFLTRDPLDAATREPYGYVYGNPLNATDPSGLSTKFVDCGWGESCVISFVILLGLGDVDVEALVVTRDGRREWTHVDDARATGGFAERGWSMLANPYEDQKIAAVKVEAEAGVEFITAHTCVPRYPWWVEDEEGSWVDNMIRRLLGRGGGGDPYDGPIA